MMPDDIGFFSETKPLSVIAKELIFMMIGTMISMIMIMTMIILTTQQKKHMTDND